MATPEELEAKIAQLEAAAAENTAKVKAAAGIQQAFTNLRGSNPNAAQYLQDLADRKEATPFWDQAPAAPEAPASNIEDLDTGAAMQQMQANFQAQLDQMSQQLLGVVNQKFQAVSDPLLAMRAKNNEASVRSRIDAQFGEGSFDSARDDAIAKANGPAGVLLQTEDGLETLMLSVLAGKAHEQGVASGQEAVLRRARTANDLYGGPNPGGARGGDDSTFDDLDFTGGNEVAALAEAFERADRAGTSLVVKE